jgi:hypothetical protein
MCIGVPTILPLIMASGLQNPKSVIFALFSLSSCKESFDRIIEFWFNATCSIFKYILAIILIYCRNSFQ